MLDQSRVAGESVDHSKALNDSIYTVGWLLDSLRNNDLTYREKFGSRKVKDVTSFDISAGKGFISTILKCTVIFEDPTEEEESYSTILKITGFDSLSKNIPDGSNLIEAEVVEEKVVLYHRFECEFYDDICPFLTNLPIPKVFKTAKWIPNQQEGCIHMEDLSPIGNVPDFFSSLNLAQVKDIVKNLAKMHKQLWTMDQGVWKGRFLETQMNFAEILDGIGKSITIMEEMAKDRFDSIIPLLRKYRKFCTNREYMEYAFAQSYKDLNLNPVVVHGDMWTSNILCSTNTEGDIENTVVGLIDWQLVHEGGPMDDIGRLLVITLDGSIRRQAEPFLLQYYFDVLTSEFSKDNLKVPFTLSQIQEAYDYMFMVQAVFPIFVTVYVGGSLEETPELKSINRAKRDNVILRSLQALEDLDRLLTGKYRHLFDKYGK